MIGIYIIKNTINDKVYNGQSVNIEERWQAHRYKGKEGVKITTPEANSPLHIDMRKDGEIVREIWRSTYPNKAESTVRNAILKVTYKDID